MPGTVAVCIPAYRGLHIAETVASVLKQTRPVDEIIILDDSSPDNIEAIISNFKQDRIRYVRNAENVGVPENYNRVFKMARSDYLMILGDHDVLHETFIDRCATRLDENPNIAFVYTNAYEIDSDGKVLFQHRHSFPEIIPGEFMARWLVTHTASPINLDTLIRRVSLENIERWFDPNYWWYADIHLWIRLCTVGDVGFVSAPVLMRRQNEGTHYLNDKKWQALLVCDRIRRDNWHLAYRNHNIASHWGKTLYSLRMDRVGLIAVMSRLADGLPKNQVIPQEAFSLFSTFSRLVIRGLLNMPRRPIQWLRLLQQRQRQ